MDAKDVNSRGPGSEPRLFTSFASTAAFASRSQSWPNSAEEDLAGIPVEAWDSVVMGKRMKMLMVYVFCDHDYILS